MWTPTPIGSEPLVIELVFTVEPLMRRARSCARSNQFLCSNLPSWATVRLVNCCVWRQECGFVKNTAPFFSLPFTAPIYHTILTGPRNDDF